MTDKNKIIKLHENDQVVRDRHAKAADYYAAQVATSSNKPETINQCIAHLLKSLEA